MKEKDKRGTYEGLSRTEFHKRTNLITLLLLIYIIILLISTSKIMDRLGQIEIERSSMTGEATGNISLRITVTPAAAAAVAEAKQAAETLSQPLTSSETLIKFSKSKFIIDLYYKEEKTEEVLVTNILHIPLDLEFSSNLDDFIQVSPNVMHLDPGEQKTIAIKFIGHEPGVASGYIFAKTKTIKAFMLAILDVSSSGLPGKVRMNLPEQFKDVHAGENILVSVSLTGFENNDVEVVYLLKNVANKEIFRTSQPMNIKDLAKFDKTLALPENLEEGLYVLAVEVRYGGQVLVDSEIITIRNAEEPVLETPGDLEEGRYFITTTQFTLIILGMVLLLVVAAVIYAYETRETKKEPYGHKK